MNTASLTHPVEVVGQSKLHLLHCVSPDSYVARQANFNSNNLAFVLRRLNDIILICLKENKIDKKWSISVP